MMNNQQKAQEESDNFLNAVVEPTFEELKSELEGKGRRVNIYHIGDSVTMSIMSDGQHELSWTLKVRVHSTEATLYREVEPIYNPTGKPHKLESAFRQSGSSNYSLSDISKEEIMQAFWRDYNTCVNES